MSFHYEKHNADIERRAQEEKDAKTRSSSDKAAMNKKLSQEEALKKIREKAQRELAHDKVEAQIKFDLAKAQAQGEGNISRGDALRFNQGKNMNARGWKSFGIAKVIFGLSLGFVGFSLYYQKGMWQREEDMLVCVNCNRQKEIAEEIYFGKTPSSKKNAEESRRGKMIP